MRASALTNACIVAGATFAKWRAVLRIQRGGPSNAAVLRNAQELAEYATICQVRRVKGGWVRWG